MEYFKNTSYIASIITLIFLVSCSSSRFTLREKRIINQTGTDDIMSLMLVGNANDSLILYKRSNNIKPDSTNKHLTKLINKMFVTVRDSNNPGVGIAAPQVGVNKRIIWVQRFDKTGEPFEVYLNPKIVYYSESKSNGREGCLSIPGFRGIVSRSDTIVINYDYLKQRNLTDTVSGFTAIIFQHETDHLEGILYTDRIKDKSKLTRTFE